MREVRRLRGEVGRAMFKEDLDREILFAPLLPPGGREPESGRVGARLRVRPVGGHGPPLRKDGRARNLPRQKNRNSLLRD